MIDLDDIDPISLASDRCDECGIDHDEVYHDAYAAAIREVLAMVDVKMKELDPFTEGSEVPNSLAACAMLCWKEFDTLRSRIAALNKTNEEQQ